MENEERTFIIIPAYIGQDKRLLIRDRYLLGLIIGLSSRDGYCWASNEYMSEKWCLSIDQIRRSLKKLEKLKMITREVVKSNKDGFTSKRKIQVTRSHKCHPRGSVDAVHEVAQMPSTRSRRCLVDSKTNNNKDYSIPSTDKPTEDSPIKRPISKEWTDLKFTEEEAKKIRKKFLDKELGQKDIDYAVLQLRIWAENKPKVWAKRKSPYLNLIGWPLERAVENKIRQMRLERESNYLVKSRKDEK